VLTQDEALRKVEREPTVGLDKLRETEKDELAAPGHPPRVDDAIPRLRGAMTMLRLTCSWHSWLRGRRLARTGGTVAQRRVSTRAPRSSRTLGSRVPFDAKLVDERGEEKALGSYFDGKRPVILNLGYYGAARRCAGAVLNGLLDGLKQAHARAGQGLRDRHRQHQPHGDRPSSRARRRRAISPSTPDPEPPSTGISRPGPRPRSARSRKPSASGTRYDASEKAVAHGAALVFLSPDGAVMRYLFGIDYSPRSLRFAIVEAGRGNVGTVVDKILLNCYRYDPKARGYALAAMTVMQWAGGITVVLVGALILLHFRASVANAKPRR
jgi:protein SCO1/2